MYTNIEEIVKQYLEIFPNEKQNLNELNNLIKHNKDNSNNLFNRKNFEGHITASGFIYSKKEGKLLLLEHKSLKKLLQPGGHVEACDNNIMDAATREILEETGLQDLEIINIAVNTDVPFDINTHIIPKNEKKQEDKHYHHDFRYLYIVDSIKEIKIDDKESNSYKWIEINEIRDNDSFIGIVDKILNLINNKYTINQYFDRIIKNFKIDLKKYNSIVISHIVPDCKEYLETINYICPILKLIPKPKSINNETYNYVKNKYNILEVRRDEILQNDELRKCIQNSNKDIIVFDIGGYFSKLIESDAEVAKKIKFIIEDTENGYQKYENVKTDIPILSVARSELKDNEDNLVGESIIFSADILLRNMSERLEYKNCGVLGYGKIGESIASHLLQKGIKPIVYDKNAIKQIRAYNRMCNISTKEKIINSCDVIFLATGNHSFDINDFRKVRNGSYIFSVTSSDDEIDSSYLEKEYSIEEIKPYIFKYSNQNNYFYLIQKGNAVNFVVHTPVTTDFIYLVMGEMIVAAQFLEENRIKNIEDKRILELDKLTRQKIAKIWLDIFKKGDY